MDSRLGVYKLLKEFWSNDRCNDFLKLLPKQDVIVQQTDKASNTGVWYKNHITDQRCTLPVDSNIIENIKTYLPDDYDYVSEKMYVTKYDVGQQCIPHHDPTDITVIILLNNEFEGGEFFVRNRKINLNKGDAILFGNKEIHAVSEITKGYRYALSLWLKQATQDKGSATKR